MRVRRREADPVGLQIAPMCDVVFLVLTFFMLTAQLTSRERSLPIRLPETSAAPANVNTGERLVVDLDAEGHLFLGGQPADSAGLRQALWDRARQGPLRVALRADAATPARRIKEIVAWSAEAGAREVILGTLPLSQGEGR